jgi:hypothetical protein
MIQNKKRDHRVTTDCLLGPKSNEGKCTDKKENPQICEENAQIVFLLKINTTDCEKNT